MVGYGSNEFTLKEYGVAALKSGILSRCLIQPLDVLKIRFQMQMEPTFGATTGKYKGFIQASLLIYREEGLSAFWKGLVPALGLSAVYSIVQFATFEWLTNMAQSVKIANENRRVTDLLCGALSGCAATSAANPFDVIRTRLVLQSSGKVYKGTMHAIFSIYKKDGFVGYFSGIVPSLMQIAPYAGLQFSLYNWYDYLCNSFFETHDQTTVLICGSLSGLTSKTMIYPLDVIRHRLQVRSFDCSDVNVSRNYRSVKGAIRSIIRNESFGGLFKGLWPSMIKAALSSGFMFSFYEMALEETRNLKN